MISRLEYAKTDDIILGTILDNNHFHMKEPKAR